jgi:WD40 repeat protein
MLRQTSVLLLTTNVWYFPCTEPLRGILTVEAPSFSPDGTRIVTTSSDPTTQILIARIWDARSGQPIDQPFQHDGIVTRASFSPDGTRIVTASGETGALSTARIWDARFGQPIGQPFRHEGPVSSANFSPDGTRIITASWDNTARIWDTRSGQPIGQPLQHEGSAFDSHGGHGGHGVVDSGCDPHSLLPAKSLVHIQALGGPRSVVAVVHRLQHCSPLLRRLNRPAFGVRPLR